LRRRGFLLDPWVAGSSPTVLRDVAQLVRAMDNLRRSGSQADPIARSAAKTGFLHSVEAPQCAPFDSAPLVRSVP
jgi:hypothetical protein